ncbi:MAG: hypothetical protein ACYC3P_08225 [Bellilinea sp.]
MKAIGRVLIVAGIIGASMLGGYLAAHIGPGRVQAAANTAFGPPEKITLLDVPNASTNPDVFGTTAVKIADVGSFNVENSESLIEVTYQGRLTITGATGMGVFFELRVDDLTGIAINPSQPSGLALVRASEAGQYVPSNFSGFWTGLAAGTHTVSVWARASANTGTNAIIDPGGWPSNIVIVKETLPFGSTFLPLINN